MSTSSQGSVWLDVAHVLLPRFLLCSAIAACCVRLCVALRTAGVLSPLLARKAMHALTGPVFCCMWLLFPRWEQSKAAASLISDAQLQAIALSRYVAASIPLVSALYFLAVGIGAVPDAGLVSAVSRSGRRQELLSGPLLYGLVNAAACAIFWLDSPAGVFLILCLCIGDGLADVAGRWSALPPQAARLHQPLPWNRRKTAVGSLTMLGSSLLAMALFTSTFVRLSGVFAERSAASLSVCGLCIAAVGTAVESLPIAEVDNLTVFSAGAAASLLCC